MRYRLRTLLMLVALLALGLAWWRDHAHLAFQLDFQKRQIRQLQEQIDRRGFSVITPNERFNTVDELVKFVRTATENEFMRENWSDWGHSYIALQAVAPLAQLTTTGNEEARHHAAWLLGLIGRNKRPLAVDPIPALIAALDDPASRVRAEAAFALGNFGPSAKAALPKLHEIMHRDLSHDAYFATMAVREIAPTEDIGPRLRELFLNGEKGVWINVAFRLPDHLPAREAKQLLLAKGERETDPESREIVAQALNKIKE